MAFTFKLARRLALAHLAVAAVALASCQDASSPDDSLVPQYGRDKVRSGEHTRNQQVRRIHINPKHITLGSFDTLRLRIVARSTTGGEFVLPNDSVTWSATGGSISTDGVYYGGPVPGDYQVVARHQGSGSADTIPVTLSGGGAAVVTGNGYTVRRINLQPRSLTIAPGGTQTFVIDARSTTGVEFRLSNDSVTWTATGGTVTSKGKYTAGSTQGSYRVIAVHKGTGKADTVPVTITGGSTPPGGGGSGGGSSHEPAGFTMISDRPFNSKTENSWTSRSDPAFTISTDAGAPHSPSNVGRAHFKAGYKGGTGPIMTSLNLRGKGKKSLYMSFWIKVSSSFYGAPSSGVNKVLHVWIDGISTAVFALFGQRNAPLMPQFRMQNIDVGTSSFNLNPNITPGVRLSRNHWYHVEIELVANTPGQSNGQAMMWIDGALAGSFNNIGFVGKGKSPNWEQISWNPTWGSPSDKVPGSMDMYMDHIYVSGK